MTDRNDEFLAPLADLRRVVPDADATGRALARTRVALEREIGIHRARWRRRIVMSGGIAAVVTFAAVIAASLLSPRAAGAAAELAKVAEANQAYRGWVHMSSQSPGERAGDEPRVGRTHLNTADGTVVAVREQGSVRRVQMFVPAARERHTYDSTTNELRIVTVTADTAADLTQEMQGFPLTVLAAEAARVARGLPPAKITERAEGALQRFDIVIPAAAAAAAAAAADAANRPATRPAIERATVWADPQTKLMVKADFALAGGKTFAVKFAYGDPPIASIHDAGVPRDAKVIDERGKAPPTTQPLAPARAR